MRVHELAKELGMTNTEMMGLAEAMGVGVKSHSSTLIEAQADRLRRRAERDGLTRPEQPEDFKPVKKTAGKKAAASKGPEVDAPAPVEVPVTETPAAAPAPGKRTQPVRGQLSRG